MLYIASPWLIYFILFIYLFFYFILLYTTVLVLPYIDMNPPRVYMHVSAFEYAI